MKTLTFAEKLHLCLGVHIVLWLNAGNYSYVGPIIPSAVKFALVGIWFALSLFGNKRFFARYVVTAGPVAFFLFLTFLGKMLGNSSYFDQYGMNFVYALILLGVFAYYFYSGSKQELRFLLVVFLLDVLIVALVTYVNLLQRPDLARILSTSAANKQELLGYAIPRGLGGYGMCYTLLFLQPIMAYWLNKKKASVLVKLMLFGAVVLLLFRAQITLAFVLYPVLWILSHELGKGNYVWTASRLLLFAGVVVLVFALPSVLPRLIEAADYHLAERLQELLDMFQTQNISGADTLSRVRLYQISLDSFFANPLWGSFGAKTYGSHSTLLDCLGAFGVLGLVGVFGLFLPLRQVRTETKADRGLEKMRKITIGIVFFLSVINPVTGSEMLLTITVIIPLFCKYFRMEFGENNESGSD
ncbi:MAG: hypothetical protein IJA11_00140 [Oscillospiraceae bacterium]|nr:hypothetical protein [Oscillospiraceae bacterium]